MTVRILDFIHSSSWAMDEASLRNVIEIASREHQPTVEALQAYKAQALARGERAKERNGVAIITAEGPMFKSANLMTEYCGASSYDVMRRDLQAAVDNPSISAILFNLDTPGGEAAGVGELAAAVASFRGVKPIVAYAGDLAASAGYWLASAADSIVIGAGAALGSIGVRATYADTSARDAARGVQAVEFVSSQSPFKRADLTSDDGKARIQARIDSMAQVFVETVATNRGVSVEHVLSSFGKGDVLLGRAAVAAGMADEIGTFETTLAALAAGKTSFGSADRPGATRAKTPKGKPKMTPEEIAAAIAAATAEATAAAEAKAATAAAAAAEAARVQASEAAAAAVAADRQRVEAIHALTITGYEAEAAEAIQKGSTAADFAVMIVKSERGKGASRAAAITSDESANAGAAVGKSPAADAPKGDDAAVNAILGGMAAVATAAK